MSKIIAVTGAGPGVGLVIAQRFGREGFSVALLELSTGPAGNQAGRGGGSALGSF